MTIRIDPRRPGVRLSLDRLTMPAKIIGTRIKPRDIIQVKPLNRTQTIIKTALDHPDWTYDQIAEHVGVGPSTVRNVASRKKLTVASARPVKAAAPFKRAGYAGKP